MAKIALLVALVLWGFGSGRGELTNFVPFFERRAGAGPLVPALAGALVMAFFSFGGWWEAAKLAGEVRDPGRTLPRALALGVSAVTLLYVSVSAVFLYMVPTAAVGSDETFATQAGPGALRPERRPRALGAGGGARELGALRLHDLRPAALLRDGEGRRRTALRGLHPPAHRDARAGDRAAGGARGAARAARQLRHRRGLLRVRDRAVPDADRGRALPPAAARAGSLSGARLAAHAARVPRDAAADAGAAGVSNPRQAALGLAVVAAGVPVYRLFIQPRRAASARLEEA